MKQFSFAEIPNFFSDGERNQIARKVLELKQYWKKLHDYNVYKSLTDLKSECSKNQYLLGDSIYPLTPKDTSEINVHVQQVLIREFKDLIYKKLIDTIGPWFEVWNYKGTEFFPNLPIPGFHIFDGKQNSEPFGWHTDTTLCLWEENINPKKLFSFLSPIMMPERGAHLEWLMPSGKESIIPYEYGTLHLWNGLEQHRIGRHSLARFEKRITLQGHIYINPNGKVQLFF
jgi:hypothetical protein